MRRTVLAGFTLVEVMIAVAVIIVGASGLIALQGATTTGNQDAREKTAALAFASTWVERVKMDSMLWIDRDEGPIHTQYLNWLVGETPDWFVPTPDWATQSANADYWGFDTLVAAERRFCANLRRTVLVHLTPDTPTTVPVAMRVDVRVWWHRSGRNSGGTNEISDKRILTNCGTGAGQVPSDSQCADPRIRCVWASTVVSVNEPELL